MRYVFSILRQLNKINSLISIVAHTYRHWKTHTPHTMHNALREEIINVQRLCSPKFRDQVVLPPQDTSCSWAGCCSLGQCSFYIELVVKTFQPMNWEFDILRIGNTSTDGCYCSPNLFRCFGCCFRRPFFFFLRPFFFIMFCDAIKGHCRNEPHLCHSYVSTPYP